MQNGCGGSFNWAEAEKYVAFVFVLCTATHIAGLKTGILVAYVLVAYNCIGGSSINNVYVYESITSAE